jgi:hypothetical protein
LRPYSPGGTLIALTSAQTENRLTPSVHRLRLGLPGYLIPFAPLAFAPQRQYPSRRSPSPLVFLPISTHFTATPGIPSSSPELKFYSTSCTSQVRLGAFTRDLQNRLRALYAQLFRVTLAPSVLPRLLARSWPELPPEVQSILRIIHPQKFRPSRQEFTTARAFILHAALLRQACAHCEKFPTAASRRSLDRVSVPVWPDTLSGRLPVVALVGLYPTNKRDRMWAHLPAIGLTIPMF